jgi:hypothetical protein
MKTSEMHSVLLHQEEVIAIHEALVKAGFYQLANLLANKATRSEMDQRYAATIPMGEVDGYSRDSNPIVSSSEDGAFVMVWQWVDQSEIGH